MGINKQWKNKNLAEENLAFLKKKISKSLRPYFKYDGKLELSISDPTIEIGDSLARFLNSTLIYFCDDYESQFGADSIIAQQVIVNKNEVVLFWGKISWLQTPKEHSSYKPGYDPFYVEFKLVEQDFCIAKMKFGDYNLTNLDKVWWFDLELNWIYEFYN